MLYIKRCALAVRLLVFIPAILAAACSQAAAHQLDAFDLVGTASPPQIAVAPAPTSNTTPTVADNITVPTPQSGPSVQIMDIHARGTLSPMSCCNADMLERDEFVAICNMTTSPQDIRGWSLKNVTKGYPTFTFPDHFPCVVYNYDPDLPGVPGGYYTLRQITPQTVKNTFTTEHPGAGPVYSQIPIDWSQCGALQMLDDTPLKPVAAQQGSLPPLILYPGQTVLVFTDEIHCQYGGLSFNFGPGDIWDNDYTDTAVLYDAQGHEVSRKSYTAGQQ